MTAPLPWDVPGRVQGIDVSAAQVRLPMPAIAAAGVRFVIAKATEGLGSVDPRFLYHVDDAEAAGVPWEGGYHFLHSSESGIAQGQWFARHLAQRPRMRVRPMIDWEDSRRIDAIGVRTALATALDCLRTVHAETGRRPMLYSMPALIARLKGQPADLLAELATYDYVVAHYRWNPGDGRDFGLVAPRIDPPFTAAVMWQCGGNGAPRIPGVSVDLDRDVFFGDEAAFLAWCDDKPVREPGLQLADTDRAPAHAIGVADRAEDEARTLAELHTLDSDEPDTVPETMPAKQKSGQMPAVRPPPIDPDATQPGGEPPPPKDVA